MKNELYYALALTKVSGIGPVNGRNLIAYCGSAEKAFKMPISKLIKIPGIGEQVAQNIKGFNQFSNVEAELIFIEKNQIRAIAFYDKEYPIRLKQLLDGPLILFAKGATADFNHPRILGIVGTRMPSQYGLQITEKIIETLAEFNVAIMSGLAFGIDIAAHKASLKYNIPTFAAVAHGLDKVYPHVHKSTAENMIKSNGAIISEHFSNTELHPDLFPRRNRIVAGMSDAVLVIESKINGGSMITADIAHSYNKEVFAIPGRSIDNMSAGCNLLIKSLKASLVENAADIAKSMNWDLNENEVKRTKKQLNLFDRLDEIEQQIVSSMEHQPVSIDQITFSTNIPISKLSLLLLDLEMRGFIRQFPGKLYGIG